MTRRSQQGQRRSSRPQIGLLAVALCLGLAAALPATAEPAAPALSDSEILDASNGADSLARFLVLPTRRRGDPNQDSLAAAVAGGGDASLERPSGFRKRSIDLFRSEHPVAVGDKEMLVRLRLRAKSRETMSVELRF